MTGKAKKNPISITIDEMSFGWKVFTSFLNEDTDFGLTAKELIQYAISELGFPEDKLTRELEECLPTILIVYMNTWSGWLFKHDYAARTFTKELYFKRFQKFMSLKISAVAKGSFTAAKKELEQNWAKDVGLSTFDSKFAPYSINIGCPPHMLNTLVFSTVGDDVIMKQHLGSPWVELSTTQLVNWPYIEVTFRTEDICFVRRQATHFFRYLNFSAQESCKPDETIIEHAEILRTAGTERSCYSNTFIETYVRIYLDTLKSLKQVPKMKFEEIQVILSQFLEDIRYINVNNSMATNTMVLFKLSPVPFIRNKKLVKNDSNPTEQRVGYCEIITPKVELILLYFRAKQKEASHVCFELTDALKDTTDEDESNVLPCIKYKCTFCNVEFQDQCSKKCMLDHLQKEHKMEQYVRCTMCKKQFDVLSLAACRWRHKCVGAGSVTSDELIEVN